MAIAQQANGETVLTLIAKLHTKDNSGNENTQGFCCLLRTQALRPYLVVFSFLETSSGCLGLVEGGDAGQLFAFEQLQAGAAAGRNVAHFLSHTHFLDRRH